MSQIKISNAEYPFMEYIWANAPITANKLAAYAQEAFGWKKNTTYTVIKRLIQRGAIQRADPDFVVTSLVTKEEIQRSETEDFIERIFKGSRRGFLASFLDQEDISEEELELIKRKLEEKK